MDALNLVANIYKKELAEANEQKVIFQAQCEQYKQKISELEKIIEEKDKEIDNLKSIEE